MIESDYDYRYEREKAKENNIKISIFYNRIKFGWSYEEACTIPVGKQGEKHRKIACN